MSFLLCRFWFNLSVPHSSHILMQCGVTFVMLMISYGNASHVTGDSPHKGLVMQVWWVQTQTCNGHAKYNVQSLVFTCYFATHIIRAAYWVFIFMFLVTLSIPTMGGWHPLHWWYSIIIQISNFFYQWHFFLKITTTKFGRWHDKCTFVACANVCNNLTSENKNYNKLFFCLIWIMGFSTVT